MVDYHSLVRVLIKLFGVGLIVLGITQLGTHFAAVIANIGTVPLPLPFLLAYVGQIGVTLLFGILLWLFPARITNSVVLPNADASVAARDWEERLERVGVTLLGLYLLYRAISDVAYHVVAQIGRSRVGIDAPQEFTANAVATLVELAVALLLVLGSRGIVTVVRRLRTAGQS